MYKAIVNSFILMLCFHFTVKAQYIKRIQRTDAPYDYLSYQENYSTINNLSLNKTEPINVPGILVIPNHVIKDTTTINGTLRNYISSNHLNSLHTLLSKKIGYVIEAQNSKRNQEYGYRNDEETNSTWHVEQILVKPIGLWENYLILIEQVNVAIPGNQYPNEYTYYKILYLQINTGKLLSANDCLGINRKEMLVLINSTLNKEKQRVLHTFKEDVQKQLEDTYGEEETETPVKDMTETVLQQWSQSTSVPDSLLDEVCLIPHPAGLLVYVPEFLNGSNPLQQNRWQWMIAEQDLGNSITANSWFRKMLHSVRTETTTAHHLNPIRMITEGSVNIQYLRNIEFWEDQHLSGQCVTVNQVADNQMRSLSFDIRYNAAGRLSSIRYMDHSSPNDGVHYTYNIQGLVQTITDNNNGVCYRHEQFFYSDKGNLSLAITFNKEGYSDTMYTHYFYTGPYVYKYMNHASYLSLDNLLMEMQVYILDANNKLYSYFSLPETQTWHFVRGPQGKILATVTEKGLAGGVRAYEYDEQQRLISVSTNENRDLFLFSYDKNGWLQQITNYDDLAIRSKLRLEYNNVGQVIKFREGENVYEILYKNCR